MFIADLKDKLAVKLDLPTCKIFRPPFSKINQLIANITGGLCDLNFYGVFCRLVIFVHPVLNFWLLLIRFLIQDILQFLKFITPELIEVIDKVLHFIKALLLE